MNSEFLYLFSVLCYLFFQLCIMNCELWIDFLPKYRINHYQQDTYRIRADVEGAVGLEDIGGEMDGFLVVVGFASGETYQHDNRHRDDAGIEHLVDEGHVNG